MTITCTFKRMRDGVFFVTNPSKLDLIMYAGRTVRCDWGGEYLIKRSPNDVYYIFDLSDKPAVWSEGRLTFEIV
jgi:hypothetical protein